MELSHSRTAFATKCWMQHVQKIANTVSFSTLPLDITVKYAIALIHLKQSDRAQVCFLKFTTSKNFAQLFFVLKLNRRKFFEIFFSFVFEFFHSPLEFVFFCGFVSAVY
jgi:hypothetical protein